MTGGPHPPRASAGVAISQGTGRPCKEFTSRFIHAFGSPNFAAPGHNCFVPRNIASALTQWLARS
jgi:hypothetical protein